MCAIEIVKPAKISSGIVHTIQFQAVTITFTFTMKL